MDPEHFLDALERAAEDGDRKKIAELGKIAFESKKLTWQSIVRHFDNWVLASTNKNRAQAELFEMAVRKLVPQIRSGK